jgi:hypothetical protein
MTQKKEKEDKQPLPSERPEPVLKDWTMRTCPRHGISYPKGGKCPEC